ncbi:hypothetical protein [Mucilaginibacter sp. dw_454]|uniref:hypothetical protein n=1 Tax=Mucilaginibacter sp. dw_454 TaxID=2720079 RepID=UPI001BD606C6|nr:hypothetical protein [Mucilaginibacter sp. dw_454]
MNYFKKALIALLFFPVLLKAQSNFHKGYVVTLTGDTIKGSIDFKEWYRNPRQIKFKADGAPKVNQYNVLNSTGFGVTGYDRFQRFVVPIAQDKINLSELSHSIDTTVIIDTVFLKVVATGNHVSLYSYNDKKEELFIQQGNEPPKSLIRHFYLVGEDRILTDARYVFQLQKSAKTYQPGDSKLFKDIERVRYDADDIAKLVYRINGSAGIVKAPAISHLANRFYLGAGINDASISTTEQNNLITDRAASSVLPAINVGYDIYLKNNIGKLIFRTELNFSGTKGDIDRTYTASSETEKLKYNQYVFSANPQLVFNIYNGENFKFFIDGGFAANLCSYSNKQYVHNIYLGGQLSTSYDVIFPNAVSSYFGFTTKAGIVLNNRVEIYAGYYPSSQIITAEQYTVSYASYRAGINLLLSKKAN